MRQNNNANQNFDIDIVQNATIAQIKESERLATFKDGGLWCPKCNNNTPITLLRLDDIDAAGDTIYGLRRWEADEFLPRSDDVFQERLYAIKYLEKNNRKTWDQFVKKPAPATDATYGKVIYAGPTLEDLNREEKVIELVKERFSNWQERGYLPSAIIEEGYNTTQPIRERGWQYWHQMFNPRQLLICGFLACELDKLSENIHQKVFCNLNRSLHRDAVS